MRLLLACLAMFVCISAVAFGGVGALVGYLDQREADGFYVVQFKRPGDKCGSSRQMHLDVADGKPLGCRPGYAGFAGGSRGSLSGFSPAQNEEVRTLAEELGADGLSDAEQRQIQARVDQILTTVPAAERPDRKPGLWGARLAWLCGGMAVAGILGIAAFFLFVYRDRHPKPDGGAERFRSPVTPG
jgi:hypothetical protein